MKRLIFPVVLLLLAGVVQAQNKFNKSSSGQSQTKRTTGPGSSGKYTGTVKIKDINNRLGKDDQGREVREINVIVANMGVKTVAVTLKALIKDKAGNPYYGSRTWNAIWDRTTTAIYGYKFNIVVDGIEGAKVDAYHVTCSIGGEQVDERKNNFPALEAFTKNGGASTLQIDITPFQ